jgi:hypothetical protein
MSITPTAGATVDNHAGATTSLTFAAFNNVAGQDIVVCVAILDTTKSVSGITDTALNTYTQKAAVNNGSAIRSEIWYTHAAVHNTSNVILVSFSGSTLAAAAYEEYSGPTGSGNSGTNTGTNTHPNVNVATQDISNFVIGCLAIASFSGDTLTNDYGGTSRQSDIPAATTAGVVLVEDTSLGQANQLFEGGVLNNSRAWAFACMELRTGGGLGQVDEAANTRGPINVTVKSIALQTTILIATEPTPVLGAIITGSPNWGGWVFENGQVNRAYQNEWDMPGIPTVTYSLHSGSLPTGLALSTGSGNVGILSGTPSVAGSYTFSLRASNVNGTVDKSFTIIIAALAVSAYAFIS